MNCLNLQFFLDRVTDDVNVHHFIKVLLTLMGVSIKWFLISTNKRSISRDKIQIYIFYVGRQRGRMLDPYRLFLIILCTMSSSPSRLFKKRLVL